MLAVGSPGGSTIITTVLQVLVERLDLGTSLPARGRRPPGEPAQRRDHAGRARLPHHGSSSGSATGSCRRPEIGAVTGVALLGGGRFQAVAEPVRRGGGSALVLTPEDTRERRGKGRAAPRR